MLPEKNLLRNIVKNHPAAPCVLINHISDHSIRLVAFGHYRMQKADRFPLPRLVSVKTSGLR